MNYNCKTVNIVWIERGIILTIIYYIIKYNKKLKNKIIIINNKLYCQFFKILFPKLKFEIYKNHNKSNFYFNIRKIIKEQDIIIDYLSNYNEIINTNKISLIPWYDMNDPLIVYKYDDKKKLNIYQHKFFIKNFSNCKRGNYNGIIWDAIIENNITQKYIYVSNNNYNQFMLLFNNFLKSNYTNTVVEIPKIYYITKSIDNNPKKNIDNNPKENTNNNPKENTDNKIDKILNIITNKIRKVNDILSLNKQVK